MDNTDRKEQMRELVAQWQAIGKSQKDFAAENNLNLHTFKYWIYKFRQDDQSPDGFMRLDGIPANEISVRYPNGVEVMIPTSTPSTVLMDLIRFAG